MNLKVEVKEEGISFRVRIRPSASRNKIKGLYREALKVDISAPPVKGEQMTTRFACLV